MNTPNLDRFTLAYIECALWSSSVDFDSDTSFESAGYDVSDLSDDLLAHVIEECADFQNDPDTRALLFAAYDRVWYSDEQAGHDFWLTRNGHGAGFWDRGLGALGDALTRAAKAYGSEDWYLGSMNVADDTGVVSEIERICYA